jgi:hypothetical protein
MHISNFLIALYTATEAYTAHTTHIMPSTLTFTTTTAACS